MRPQGLKQGAGFVLDAHVLTLGPSGLTGTVLAQELSLQGSYLSDPLIYSVSCFGATVASGFTSGEGRARKGRGKEKDSNR